MAENQKEEKTLEEAFSELDVLADKLEDRETSLEDSFRLYKQGMGVDHLHSRHKRISQLVLTAKHSAGLQDQHRAKALSSCQNTVIHCLCHSLRKTFLCRKIRLDHFINFFCSFL